MLFLITKGVLWFSPGNKGCHVEAIKENASPPLSEAIGYERKGGGGV